MGSAAKRKRRHVEPEDSGEEDVIFKEHGSGTDDEQVSGDSDARAYSSSDRQMDASEDEDAEGSEISFEEEEDDDGEEKDGESEGEGDSGSDENSARRKLKPNRGGAEMEELEKEYENLRNQEQTILSGLKRQKDEDFMKGQAIKNQKALWNRNLEFRFLLQKPFSIANKLPQEPLRSQFLSHDENLEKLYSELILSSEQTLNSMLELQEALIEKNVSISVENNDTSNKVEDENDDIWSRIQKMQCRIAPFRNSSIDRWQRKTQVTSGAAAFKSKLHAFNQNISDQVSGHMRDPSRMIDRMMMKRSAVGILGESAEWANEASQEGENAIDGDPELIDDSEFYQQLLKEFFETFDLSSEPAVYTLKKLQTKKRKTVDRRASKSRKIRYHVHEKIINFMAPKPMVLSPMAPKLFENLFGLRRKSEP